MELFSAPPSPMKPPCQAHLPQVTGARWAFLVIPAADTGVTTSCLLCYFVQQPFSESNILKKSERNGKEESPPKMALGPAGLLARPEWGRRRGGESEACGWGDSHKDSLSPAQSQPCWWDVRGRHSWALGRRWAGSSGRDGPTPPAVRPPRPLPSPPGCAIRPHLSPA